MDEKKLIENIKYLVEKYLDDREDLIKLIEQDIDSVKYILSEISKYKKRNYEKADADMIKDISFYYI